MLISKLRMYTEWDSKLVFMEGKLLHLLPNRGTHDNWKILVSYLTQLILNSAWISCYPEKNYMHSMMYLREHSFKRKICLLCKRKVWPAFGP